MNFWNKYKSYIIGLIIAVLSVASIIIYVELTSGKKAEIIVKPESLRIDSLFKLINKTNNSIDSVAKNITITEYIINVKENNYKKIINNYEKDSIAIANYDADSINSFIARELKKRKNR
jgi:hypothetical protein